MREVRSQSFSKPNIDVTDSKRLQDHLEEAVKERTAQLERRNAELEAFSCSLSHDIRGPLRAILSFTQLTLQDCGAELSQTAKEYLGQVNNSAQRLDRLIQDVLVLSKVSLQPFELRGSTFSAAQWPSRDWRMARRAKAATSPAYRTTQRRSAQCEGQAPPRADCGRRIPAQCQCHGRKPSLQRDLTTSRHR